MRRAAQLAVRGQGIIYGAGQSEIRNGNAARLVFQQHVRRLDVAVDQPFLMGGGQAIGDLDPETYHLVHGQRARCRQHLLQRTPLDVFQNEIRRRLVSLHAVDGDNVLMLDRRRRPSLLDEPPACRGVVGQHRTQNLDGYDAVENRVPGLEDNAHAAAAENVKDEILVEPIGGFEAAERTARYRDGGIPGRAQRQRLARQGLRSRFLSGGGRPSGDRQRNERLMERRGGRGVGGLRASRGRHLWLLAGRSLRDGLHGQGDTVRAAGSIGHYRGRHGRADRVRA